MDGSTCVATLWSQVPSYGPEYQRRLCQGKKKCYGLVIVEQDTDMDAVAEEIYEPPLPFKYSRAAIWLIVKPLKVSFEIWFAKD